MTTLSAVPNPTLADRLGRFSRAALEKIAKTLHVPPAGRTSDGYVTNLAAFLGTRMHREFLAQTLTPDEWTLLAQLALRPGPFRLRALLLPLRARGVDSDEVLRQVSRVFSLGCLLLDRVAYPYGGDLDHLGIEPGALRTTGPYAWLVLAPGIGHWAVERAGVAAELPPATPPAAVVPSRQSDLLRAIFLILAEAGQKPIRLTAKGTLYKAELTRLAAALANAPVNPRTGKGKAPAGEPPVLLWFAFSVLIGSGLLDETIEGLAPSGDAATFFALPPAEQTRRLIRGWEAGPYNDFAPIPGLVGSANQGPGFTWSRPDPWFPREVSYPWGPGRDHMVRARPVILHAVERAGAAHPDAWFSLDDLAAQIYREDPEFLFDQYDDYQLLAPSNVFAYRHSPSLYYGLYRRDAAKDQQSLHRDVDWPEVEGAFVRQVAADALSWLGLVETGPSEAQPERYRLTDLARHLFYGRPLPLAPAAAAAGPPARVQPNFEVVVVDALANTPIVARLDLFAARQSFDRAATYRLTQDALVRGLDRGLTGDEILGFLGDIGGPLPQNVDYTLRDWIRLYQSLSLREMATLVEADTPDQLDCWLADARFATLLGRRLGPRTALLPARHAQEFTELLRQSKPKLRRIDYATPRRHVLQIAAPDAIEVEERRLEPYLRYRLAAVAEKSEPRDGKVIYRITPASVRAFTASGGKIDEVVAFLIEASSNGVNLDFYTRLYGWGGAVKPLRYEPLVAAYLPSEPVGWDALVGIPSIAPLVRFRPTPELALIRPADLDALRSELAIRGIDLDAVSLTDQDLGVLPGEQLDDTTAEPVLQVLGDPSGLLEGLRAMLGSRLPRPKPRI